MFFGIEITARSGMYLIQLVLMRARLYILVNNSGKIEVAGRNDMKSITTINKIASPRYISFIGGTKAYVTSLYSDSVTILDLKANSVSGFINLKKSSEAIVSLSATAYAASWAGGNKVMVINTDF